LHALELRFAPTAYRDPKGNLFKLNQITSITLYMSDFESLENPIVGLSPLDLLSYFVSALKPEVRCEVLAQQPTTLNQAAGLARLQEEKINDLYRSGRIRPSPPWAGAKPPDVNQKPITEAQSGSSGAPPLLPTPTSNGKMEERGEN
jgi:hypothetical protein